MIHPANPTRDSTPTRRIRRRGVVHTGLLWGGLILGSCGVVGAVVTPKLLLADDAGSADAATEIVAVDDAHQAVFNGLAAVLERSCAVIAVHERGSSPFVEIVLWLDDRHEPGRLNRDEIAVVSHSRVMHMITLYTLASDVPDDERRALAGPDALSGGAAFCNAWRASHDVEARIIATSVEDMTAAWATPGAAGESRLEIALAWAAKSTDAGDAARRVLTVACTEKRMPGAS